ncbi:MAG: hypothetical protein ACRDDZ_05965 [Marinifilaceae bacterium]
METNVRNFELSSNIPAGMFQGTEVFFHNNIAYAIHNGMRMSFKDLPGRIQRDFFNEYYKDTEAQKIIRSMGINGVNSEFNQYLFCRFGALDGSPDYIEGKITEDCFNSSCKRDNCPGRGKLCGRTIGLKAMMYPPSV